MKKVFLSLVGILALVGSAAAQTSNLQQNRTPAIGDDDQLPSFVIGTQIPIRALPPVRVMLPPSQRGTQTPQPLAMRAGKVIGNACCGADSTSAIPFMVWQTCAVCAPWQADQIWFQALGAVPASVSVSVTEYYYGSPEQQGPIWARNINVRGSSGCPGCFFSIPLYGTQFAAEDTFGTSDWGRHDFVVQFVDLQTGKVLQNTTLRSYGFAMPPEGDTGQISIDSIVTIPLGNNLQEIIAVGRFPVNQPMYYWFGTLGYQGGFTSLPSCVSTDGYTAAVGVIGSNPGPNIFRGGVALMTGDGSYAATLTGTYSF